MKLSSTHDHLVGKEMPYSHPLMLGSAVVFLLVWFIDSFLIKLTIGLGNFVPWIVRLVLGLFVILIAIWLVRLAEDALFETHETQAVINTGIMARVRHPLYLGTILFYVGLFLGTFSILSLIVFIVIFLLYDKMATYEEKDLERIFGEKYLDYKRRVPKWIPRLSSAI